MKYQFEIECASKMVAPFFLLQLFGGAYVIDLERSYVGVYVVNWSALQLIRKLRMLNSNRHLI